MSILPSRIYVGVSTIYVRLVISTILKDTIFQIVSAMKYLHKPRQYFGCEVYNKTLHLDLKRENVLLDQDLHAKVW